MLSRILRHTSIPLWARYEKSPYLRVAARLERERHLSLDERQARQLALLRSMLAHAAATTDFYRAQFRACGFAPGDLRSLDDLRLLPTVSKAQIREHGAAMQSRAYRPAQLVLRTTSGSTGMPLKMFVDADCMQLRRGVLLHRDQWTGWRAGEKRALLRGAPPAMPGRRDRMRNALVHRNLYLNTLHMHEAEMAVFARRVLRERPVLLFGHAHSLYLFARFWEAQALPAYRFRAALCTAMPLPRHERETLARVFQAEVFDRYGAEELSLIATECAAHAGLHINTDGLVVEVVPDGLAAEGGRIVVTDLWNRGMPLLRYDLGDRVVPESRPCACGRSYPLLRTVTGRVADHLWTADGRRVSGIAITEHFAELFPDVQQVQVVQNRTGHVHVRLVPGAAPADRIAARVAQVVAAAFGAGTSHDLEPVREILPEPSGKFRFSVCTMPATGDAGTPAPLPAAR